MTAPTPPPYTPANRDGYAIATMNASDPNAQTLHVITRSIDGVGLGAYASEQEVDQLIAADRAMIATLPPSAQKNPPPLVNTMGDPHTIMKPPPAPAAPSARSETAALPVQPVLPSAPVNVDPIA